tara:strand:- start:1434 stop:1817 length:384 start_codon:yes stop_codon:yes gene_type:complete
MKLKFNKILSTKGKSLIICNIIAVFIFAGLYYLIDYIISYYPEFAEKYLLEELPKGREHKSTPIFTLKPPIYYLWFSLITQTTVGYTGVLTLDNEPQNFVHMRSVPFKILNIIQLFSIFVIPALILI